VNVFLGLGMPWVIATWYESTKYGGDAGKAIHGKDWEY
tara:strand:- start:449 stop:562 length:114 start_codon:yes stop_codon:yes gene_type:complete